MRTFLLALGFDDFVSATKRSLGAGKTPLARAYSTQSGLGHKPVQDTYFR